MKILYIANARIPTERAHGVQIMKMCEAFARLGHKVELVVPWRFNAIKAEPFSYYSVKKSFKIRRLLSIDLVKFGRIGFLLQTFSFAKSIFVYVLFKKADLYYGRDEIPLAFARLIRRSVIWEAHMPRYNVFARFVVARSKKLIVISEGLKKFFVERGVPEEKIVVAHDGVDLEQFNVLPSKAECRQKLNLPQDEKIVLYTGHLYTWKGVDVLAAAALSLSDAFVYFVGGTEKDIVDFKKRYSEVQNIRIVGHKPQSEIACWLRAADVLALPNSGESEISKSYTSPLKMFEYMASGTPIVASDLSSIREILSEGNATLVHADDAGALAQGVRGVMNNKEDAHTRAQQALEDVCRYTWEKRAKMIVTTLK